MTVVAMSQNIKTCPTTQCKFLLKVIYKGCFKSFVALYADRICSDQHFVENRIEKIPIRLEVIVISYLSIPFFLGE